MMVRNKIIVVVPPAAVDSCVCSDDSDDGPAEPAVIIIGILEKSDKNKDKSYNDNKDPGKTNQR
jgi:hypothetical protein